MKKILLINVSPRTKGTSFVLLNMCHIYLEEKGHQVQLFHLYQSKDDWNRLIEAVDQSDIFVIGGPCYINTYPAETIALLTMLAEHKEILTGKSLYGMIQGGMPYCHTHESGLSMLQIFCQKCNISYKGGFVMGLGAMLDGKPVTNLPNSKRVIKHLNRFYDAIDKEEYSPAKIYQDVEFKVPSWIDRIMAKKLNRSFDKDLISRGIDIHQKSPYLR